MTMLWVVGRYVSGEDFKTVWDFMGVFDSEERAVAACLSPDCWVAPATLNESLPLESQPWAGLYYPADRAESA